MTDLPPPGAEVAATTPAQKRKKFPLYFHASIRVDSPLRVVPSGVELNLGQAPLTIGVTEQQRRALEEHPPEPGHSYALVLWFRTPEGYVQELELAKVLPTKEPDAAKPASSKPQFSVGARLETVNREEGFLTVEVERNPQGALTEPFPIQVWAALDLLDRLPKPGRTLIVTGEYRPQSGRLIATRCAPVRIGEPKSPPERKTKATPKP